MHNPRDLQTNGVFVFDMIDQGPASPSRSPMAHYEKSAKSPPSPSVHHRSASSPSALSLWAASKSPAVNLHIQSDARQQAPLCTLEHPTGNRKRQGPAETRPDDDRVYMINVGDGSWSGCLPSDDEETSDVGLRAQIELAIKRLKKRQGAAKQGRRRVSSDVAEPGETTAPGGCHHCSVTVLEKNALPTTAGDHARNARQKLNEGAILQFEYAGLTDQIHACALANYNRSREQCDPGYHLLLRDHSDPDSDIHYCLLCLEDLWNNFAAPTEQPIDAEEKRPMSTGEDHISDINIDGATITPGLLQSDGPLDVAFTFKAADENTRMHRRLVSGPASLLASKHAPRSVSIHPNAARSKSSLVRHGGTSVSLSSLGSIPDELRERQALKPFQYLASSIEPGVHLPRMHRAALNLWKLATKEQIHWDSGDRGNATIHRAHVTKPTRVNVGDPRVVQADGRENYDAAEAHCCMESLCIEVGDVDQGENAGDIEQIWCDESGLTKRDCYGKNLSTVLERLVPSSSSSGCSCR